MKHILAIILLFVSSIGIAQETIDEMFDDGLVHGFKIHPSVDVVKLIVGTPNVNLELLPHKNISFTAGIGITPLYRIRSMGEIVDGDSIIETGIKFGTFLHLKANFYYIERKKTRAYFGIVHNRNRTSLKEIDINYSSKYYKLNQVHFGGGIQWHGAHNITMDYFLGVGFTGKRTYGDNILGVNKLIDDEVYGGFMLSFKIGYPIK